MNVTIHPTWNANSYKGYGGDIAVVKVKYWNKHVKYQPLKSGFRSNKLRVSRKKINHSTLQ